MLTVFWFAPGTRYPPPMCTLVNWNSGRQYWQLLRAAADALVSQEGGSSSNVSRGCKLASNMAADDRPLFLLAKTDMLLLRASAAVADLSFLLTNCLRVDKCVLLDPPAVGNC